MSLPGRHRQSAAGPAGAGDPPANSDWPAARWWEAYDDPQLNMLINRALQNSPTMQAARLRISQSQSTVELARSAMGLQATAVAAQNRLRITDKSFSWPYSYSLPVDKNGPGIR